MASVEQIYLEAGGTIIASGSPSAPTAYKPVNMNLPQPQSNGAGGWDRAERTFHFDVTGTPSQISAATIALRRALSRGNILSFRRHAAATLNQSRISHATVHEPEYDPTKEATARTSRVVVVIATDPYWLAPWGDWTVVSVPAAAPNHFDITNPGGDTDALVSVRLIPSVATTGIYLGGYPAPAAGYDYLDGHDATLTLDATWKRFVSPFMSVSSRANAGRHLPLIHTSGSGIPSTTRVRSVAKTAGYNMTADKEVVGLAAPSVAGNSIELLPVMLPPAAVPSASIVADITAAHNIEMTDDNAPTVTLKSTCRIPLDYAAVLSRVTLPANQGLVYDGDVDLPFIADIDGVGYTLAGVGDVIRPLRAIPNGITRFVYGLTGTFAIGTVGTLAYRTRPRYLTAMG